MPTVKHGLAEAVLDLLRELGDVALGVGRVLDLLVGDLRGVDRHERLVVTDEARGAAERLGVEDDVAVHPEDAAGRAGAERSHEALRGVGLVVLLVVDERRVREGLDDVLELVPDDHGDAGAGAEGGVDVLELLLHDRAAVAELGERLGQRAAEAAAEAGGEDDDLLGRELGGAVGAAVLARGVRGHGVSLASAPSAVIWRRRGRERTGRRSPGAPPVGTGPSRASILVSCSSGVHRGASIWTRHRARHRLPADPARRLVAAES
jgi:hypothetical protein